MWRERLLWVEYWSMFIIHFPQHCHSKVVKVPAFHMSDPGSIPGLGEKLLMVSHITPWSIWVNYQNYLVLVLVFLDNWSALLSRVILIFCSPAFRCIHLVKNATWCWQGAHSVAGIAPSSNIPLPTSVTLSLLITVPLGINYYQVWFLVNSIRWLEKDIVRV